MSEVSISERPPLSSRPVESSAVVIEKDGVVALVTARLGLRPGPVVEVDERSRSYAVHDGDHRPLVVRDASGTSIEFLLSAPTLSIFERRESGGGFLFFQDVPIRHVAID